MENLDIFIRRSRQQGHADEHIRQNLLKAGWQPEQIENALKSSSSEQAEQEQKSKGEVIRGGFQPPHKPQAQPNDIQYANDLLTANLGSGISGSSSNTLVYRNVALLVMLLIVIGTVSVLSASMVSKLSTKQAAKTKNHTTANTSSPSKTSSSKSNNTQSTASSTAQPAGSSANSGSTSQPVIVTLTNQDNGRTISEPVHTFLSIQLGQLTNLTGYHWTDLAESTSTRQLGKGLTPFSRGADGSVSESVELVASGNFVLGYADNADCSPGCEQPPLELWQVHIDVP